MRLGVSGNDLPFIGSQVALYRPHCVTVLRDRIQEVSGGEVGVSTQRRDLRSGQLLVERLLGRQQCDEVDSGFSD